jgi:hypothetical protein
VSSADRVAKSLCTFPRKAGRTDLSSTAHAKSRLQSLEYRLSAKMHLRTTNVLRPSQSGEIRGRDSDPAIGPEACIISPCCTRLGLHGWFS